MSEIHHAPQSDWIFVEEDPGGHWELPYRMIWWLEAHFDHAALTWRCIARAEGAANGYAEESLPGTFDDPWPAMKKCYELADSRMSDA